MTIFFLAFHFSCENRDGSRNAQQGHRYFLRSDGNNLNDGSKESPWKTIDRLNAIHLEAGDSVYFHGGDIFDGSVQIDSTDSGSKDFPVVLTSYGNGHATIRSGNQAGLVADHASFVHIIKLDFSGSGRKEGNTKNGVAISQSDHMYVDNLNIKGYQKSGLDVLSCSEVDINGIHARDNGFAGISVSGSGAKSDNSSITIRHCIAENNPGDPTNLTNHSGNGIIVGSCRNVLIEYCAATNNGWDMPRIGNGP